MANDLPIEHSIQLVFRSWIHATNVLVDSGCSAHLLKVLSKVCAGHQVDPSYVDSIESYLLVTSTDQPSINGDELVGLTDISSKTSTTNYLNSPFTKGTAATVPNDATQVDLDNEDEDESDEDDKSDLDNLFAVSPLFVSACASLSQYRNPAPPLATEERTLNSQTCPVVSPDALALVVTQQSSWNRKENDNGLPLGQHPNGIREASLSSKSSRMNTQEPQVTRREESIRESGGSSIPLDILPTIQRIAGPEIISTLWHYLQKQRTSPTGMYVAGKHEPTELGDIAEGRIEKLLSIYQLAFNALSSDCSYFPELPRRLYLANIYILYRQETVIRRQLSRQRKRRKSTDGIKFAKKSLNDIFIDLLLPQLQGEKSTRQNAKKRFENWMALGRICAKLVESFGAGIFLLPRDLSNEILRALTLRQEDAIITYIHHVYPGLKSDIQHLTTFLLHVVEEQRPPDMKLKLELLSENDMISYKWVSQAIKDLFDYSDEVDYTSFLTDEALSSSATELPHLFTF